MAFNKGIIIAFSLLVGCGSLTAVYLLYKSKKDSNGNGNGNEDENEKDILDKGIKKIEEIFDKHEKNDDNNDMKKSIIIKFKGHLDLDKAKNEANAFLNDENENEDENENKNKNKNKNKNNRNYSSDSSFSFASDETLDGGKKTQKVIKRSKKSRSKKSKSKKSKSKSKLYKKLI